MNHSMTDTLRILREHANENTNIKFPIEAGLLMRGTVRNWIQYARNKGLTVYEFEQRGLIDSLFHIEIHGKASLVADVMSVLPANS